MSKVFHVRDAELIRALKDGADLIAGQRRFRLVEVQDSGDEEPYDITDPKEIALIDKALQDTPPSLSGEEARVRTTWWRKLGAGVTSKSPAMTS